MITFIKSFKNELATEAAQTRRMLERVPDDKFDWKPHPKSMDIKTLAAHVAEMPQMFIMALKYPRWDMSDSPYPPTVLDSKAKLLSRFDFLVEEAQAAIDDSSDDILEETWSMGAGDITFMKINRLEAVRHAFGQNAHHRAQLQVCLRLLDIPVPGPYGPSADEMG
ncbi:MAG: DinB family protein [Saprospiraceae bacterium]